ncbi:unnamed protein product [Cutaneotrichosporon oleaginosum]
MSAMPAPEASPEAPPTPRTSFTVSSGAICFGDLHNMWHGAGVPIQPFRTTPADMEVGGTVRVQQSEYNTVARNGVWHVYALICRGVTGWFAAHESVAPRREMRRILRVSGSPASLDPGSTFNDEDTVRAGVFVLNRYDWGYYDRRSEGEVRRVTESGPWTIGVGVCDYGDARAAVRAWEGIVGDERAPRPAGVWMAIPNGEYLYGRIGYGAGEAHSFLFFNTYTQFESTTFEGTVTPLSEHETIREMFERRLREGYDFGSRRRIRSVIPRNTQIPPAAERTRVARDAYILSQADVTRALEREEARGGEAALSPDVAPLLDAWREATCNLVNDMFISFLQRRVAPHAGGSLADAAGAIFARPPPIAGFSVSRGFATLGRRVFMEVDQPPDLDAAVVGRIKLFLQQTARGVSDELVAATARLVACVFREVMEEARNCSLDKCDYRIMPCHIRLVVVDETLLFEWFKYSPVFWEGIGE